MTSLRNHRRRLKVEKVVELDTTVVVGVYDAVANAHLQLRPSASGTTVHVTAVE